MCEVKVETDIKEHPVWKIIQNYGLEDKRQAQLAFFVYMDLCEAKGWWNVKTHVNEELGVVFLSGHACRSKPREVILPISSVAELSPAEIQNYMKVIKRDDHSSMELVLGICSADSSTVYYRVTDGLVLPESPEMSEWKRYRREEIPKLQREHMCRQRDLYCQAAQKKEDS